MMEKKHSKQKYRLFVKQIVEGNRVEFDKQGRRIVPVEWVEVNEINLGSLKNPNIDVIEVKFEPFVLE